MKKTAAFVTTRALLGAWFFVVVNANADGPVPLTARQMDAVTAAGPVAPTAATQALADATGIYVMTSTNVKSYVRAHEPPDGYPRYAASYVTVTSGTATAASVGGPQKSFSTSVESVNEQPGTTFGASINRTVRGLSSEITIQSQMQFGGLAFDRLAHIMSMFGRR